MVKFIFLCILPGFSIGFGMIFRLVFVVLFFLLFLLFAIILLTPFFPSHLTYWFLGLIINHFVLFLVGDLFGHVRKRHPWADPKIVKVAMCTLLSVSEISWEFIQLV